MSFKVTDFGTKRKLIYGFIDIKTIARQILRIKSWIYKSATEFPPWIPSSLDFSPVVPLIDISLLDNMTNANVM